MPQQQPFRLHRFTAFWKSSSLRIGRPYSIRLTQGIQRNAIRSIPVQARRQSGIFAPSLRRYIAGGKAGLALARLNAGSDS